MPSATRLASKFVPSKDLPDLKERVIVVTGGTSGIGYSIVEHLARAGAKIYLAARSETKARGTIARLEKQGVKCGLVIFLELELSDPRKAKQAAENFLALETRLDVLINCAAVIFDDGDIKLTSDGIPEVIAVNYLGPLVFSETLLPLMKTTAATPPSDVRIVNVSTGSHTFLKDKDLRFDSKEAWNNKFEKSTVPSLRRYSYSRLAFQMWNQHLLRRLDEEKSPIELISLHPGAIFTDGSISALKTLPLSSLMIAIARCTFQDPSKAAYMPCFAAASPLVRDQASTWHGVYLKPGMIIAKPSALAMSEKKQIELRDFTNKFLNELGIRVG